jgi:hypothetical protein
MPPLKRAPSGSPTRAGPRESLSDSPAKATPPLAQRFCLEDGITGTGLGFNALLAGRPAGWLAMIPSHRMEDYCAIKNYPPRSKSRGLLIVTAV